MRLPPRDGLGGSLKWSAVISSPPFGRRFTPLGAGFGWAVLAALSFGVTTPLVQRFGTGLGAWTTAALLYGGAAAFALPFVRDGGRVLARVKPRTILLAEAIVGAMLAPAALAYGLRSTSALGASLALNAEVPFSIAIAVFFFREHVSRRMGLASVAILAGASLLVADGGGGRHGAVGLAFVLAATLLWAIDNALSSLLVDVPFATTVAVKATFGALFAGAVALAVREPPIQLGGGLGLAVVGALGYGASLWAYLRAQRTFGIARTASVFALAPFVGAALAFGLGDRRGSPLALVAFACVALGAYLHASERHGHAHRHEEDEHDHYHRHDDAHHLHSHDDEVRGAHAHVHRHAALTHDHPHAPDPEHLHVHDT